MQDKEIVRVSKGRGTENLVGSWNGGPCKIKGLLRYYRQLERRGCQGNGYMKCK